MLDDCKAGGSSTATDAKATWALGGFTIGAAATDGATCDESTFLVCGPGSGDGPLECCLGRRAALVFGRAPAVGGCAAIGGGPEGPGRGFSAAADAVGESPLRRAGPEVVLLPDARLAGFGISTAALD